MDDLNKTTKTHENAQSDGDTQETKNPYLIKFSKPYKLDGDEYKELDLSGMENLAAPDLYKATKLFSMDGFISPKPEADPKFGALIAAAATGIPHTEFNKLSIKDAAKVRDAVFSFFQGED